MKTVPFNQLDPEAKANAQWQIGQRNKVASYKYKGRRHRVLTVDNSLFYTNGVYAKPKSK